MDSFVKARRRILDIDFERADLSGASINLALKNNVMACLQDWQITSLGETRKMTFCSVLSHSWTWLAALDRNAVSYSPLWSNRIHRQRKIGQIYLPLAVQGQSRQPLWTGLRPSYHHKSRENLKSRSTVQHYAEWRLLWRRIAARLYEDGARFDALYLQLPVSFLQPPLSPSPDYSGYERILRRLLRPPDVFTCSGHPVIACLGLRLGLKGCVTPCWPCKNFKHSN